MLSYIKENKIFFIYSILIGGVFSTMFLGIWLIGEDVKADIKELHKQIKIENDEKREIWNSLDCSGKKEYLTDKNIRPSSLFFYNINEQFYREYVMECTG